MVEQWPFKPLVEGSSPSTSTRRDGRKVMREFAKLICVGASPTHASKKDLTIKQRKVIL